MVQGVTGWCKESQVLAMAAFSPVPGHSASYYVNRQRVVARSKQR